MVIVLVQFRVCLCYCAPLSNSKFELSLRLLETTDFSNHTNQKAEEVLFFLVYVVWQPILCAPPPSGME